MPKEKKVYVSFYLEKSILARLKKISDNPDAVFDDVSTLIRYCVKTQLPTIEHEIESKEEKR